MRILSDLARKLQQLLSKNHQKANEVVWLLFMIMMLVFKADVRTFQQHPMGEEIEALVGEVTA
jgi:hypothetical protein